MGVCVLHPTLAADAQLQDRSGIVCIEALEFKDCKTLFEKADKAKEALDKLKTLYDIKRVAVEEALLGFRPGMSSAATISTLMRFNGIVSYLARGVFGVDPEYVAANHARKVCGIKLLRTSVAGKSQKQQVFEHMAANDLKFVQWPKKKSGKMVDWALDATDAYVVARAAYLNTKSAST